MTDLAKLTDHEYCYLTTTGRRSGREHTIEIWFVLHGTTAYLLAGGGDRADWVRNLQANPATRLRIADQELAATARIVTDRAEARRARDALYAKYQSGYGSDLTEWRDSALPVALEVDLSATGPQP